MDSAQSLKQSKEQLEVTHKETDAISDRSNSNSSCTSDLSQDSAVSSIFQSDPPVDLQSKPDVTESLGAVQTVENPSIGSLSRIQSSSRGSSHIRLSGVLGNHDPNRIPVSIFSGRPSNPTEWSTASNESLFSIHVGNNSFSREHFNFFTKSGELMMNPSSSQTLPSLPPFVEPAAARVESKTEVTEKTFTEPATSTGPQIPATSSQSVVDNKKEVTTTTDELRGRQSADSMNSSRSFQFPLLGSEGATPKTTSSVSTDSGATSQQQPQQQPVTKLQSKKRQSAKHQPPELQSPSQTTSPSPTTNSDSGWFSCLSCCRCR